MIFRHSRKVRPAGQRIRYGRIIVELALDRVVDGVARKNRVYVGDDLLVHTHLAVVFIGFLGVGECELIVRYESRGRTRIGKDA